MFSDLDDTIKQILIQGVPLDPNEVEISFDIPTREWSGRLTRPAVNCFLYDVRENMKLRQQDWRVRRNPNNTATSTRAPMRVDATYQITTWARVPEDEHRLLWRALFALAKYSTIPTELLQGDLKSQPMAIPTSVGDPEKMPSNFAEVWQGLDNRVRPYLTYVVTLGLDLDLATTAPLVLKAPAIKVFNLERLDAEAALRIRGRVRDRNEPAKTIAGALVELQETGDRTVTDDEGRFTFGAAPRGAVTLVVRAKDRDESTWRGQVPSPSYEVEI